MPYANPDEYRAYQRKYQRERFRARYHSDPAWAEKHREYVRKSTRKRRGVLNATGDTKHAPCPVCTKIRQLYFDHDHNSGHFRGWLCRDCNTKIEWFIAYKHNVENYLTKGASNLA